MRRLLNPGVVRMASLVNSSEYLRNKLYQSCTNFQKNFKKSDYSASIYKANIMLILKFLKEHYKKGKLQSVSHIIMDAKIFNKY